ncbi:HDOD domain-containing protein [Phosphitispora sp. TUW77]|uniref:HDOD domain-containing protein n=1 Tax=Phosphitispora sp. TUW77 TaxID=3152361 RepID=UPI003AB1F177
MAELSLDDVVQKVEELPALPHVTYRVLELTSKPDTSLNQLSDIITQDQVLTAKVLRMANSVYYGFARRIFGITEALLILGFSTVRNLVMAASVYNVMDREVQGYFLPKGELWKHSMSTALIGRSLSKKIGYEFPDQAFVAGLLHDIGKLILNTYMTQKFEDVISKVAAENIPFMLAEQQILGFDHAVIGSTVAEKWNLPFELVEAIANHHTPALAKYNPKLTSIIHVADAASMSMGIGLGGDGMLYPFDGFATELLDLNNELIEETIAEIADSLIDAETMIENHTP